MNYVYTDWFPLAAQVARKYLRLYPGVDGEDLRQELHIFLWQHGPAAYDRHRAAGHEEDDFGALLNRALSDHARSVCKDRRAQIVETACTYYYRPADVRTLLSYWADSGNHRDMWQSAWIPEDLREPRATAPAQGPVNEDEPVEEHPSGSGHDAVDVLTDISIAFNKLGYAQRRAIFAAHFTPSSEEGKPDWGEAGFALGVEPDAARMAYGRAVDALCDILNGAFARATADHDGPGSRKVW